LTPWPPSPLQAAGLVSCFKSTTLDIPTCFKCVLAITGLGAEYCASLASSNPYMTNVVATLATALYPTQVGFGVRS